MSERFLSIILGACLYDITRLWKFCTFKLNKHEDLLFDILLIFTEFGFVSYKVLFTDYVTFCVNSTDSIDENIHVIAITDR